jgi:hypothetical protein
MNIVENMKWGGSGIEKVVYDFILNHVAEGETIIEFGGGNCSTRVLGSKYSLYTIEHNSQWLSHKEYTNYIYAPIKNGWYDRSLLENKIPKDIKLIFVDGPSGSGTWLRSGLLKNLDLFENLDKISFVFHDTWRKDDKKLAEDLSKKINREVVFYEDGNPKDYWAFIK